MSRRTALIGSAVALGLAFNLQASGAKAALFSGMLVVDPLGAAFKVILVAAGLLTVLAFTFRNSRELRGLGQGELMALVLALVLLWLRSLGPRLARRSASGLPSTKGMSGFAKRRPLRTWDGS